MMNNIQKEIDILYGTIKGEMNRMCVIHEYHELDTMALYARKNLEKLTVLNFKRIKAERESGRMNDLNEKLEAIFEYYGWNVQKNKLFEELSGLIVAIAKKRSSKEILSEIAECYNMLYQTCINYGFSETDVLSEMSRKADRTLNIIVEDTEV